MKKIFQGIILIIAGLSLACVFSTSVRAATIEELQALILQLTAQIRSLQGAVQQVLPTTTSSASYSRDLTVGSKGSDVEALQRFLISKGYLSLPPGTGVGFYGDLTRIAVARWQSSSGLTATGYFGPQSRSVIPKTQITTASGGVSGTSVTRTSGGGGGGGGSTASRPTTPVTTTPVNSGAGSTGATSGGTSVSTGAGATTGAGASTGAAGGATGVTTGGTSGSAGGSNGSVPTQIDLSSECSQSTPGRIWCDDFEQNRSGSYFEYDNDAGDFVRTTSKGVNGSTAMRALWQSGEADAGYLHLAFGKTPSSYFRAVDGGTANYRDIYWRVYIKNQPGWVGGSGDKLSRATVFGSSNFAQAASTQVWGMNTNYLGLDPISGTDISGTLKATTYNDFNNFRWLGAKPGNTALFSSANVGQWYCVEAHMKLNDAGQVNGQEDLWINGNLEAQHIGVNWLGSFSTYGINSVYLENYWNSGSSALQERYMDNFVVSTQRIGCGTVASSGSTPAQPATTGTVNVSVNVVNTLGGSASASSFDISVSGASANPSSFKGNSSSQMVTVSANSSYAVSAATISNYSTTLSLGCSGSLAGGASAGCIITETYAPPIVTPPVTGDVTPPVASNGQPTGTLAAGTTQTTLSVSTDENATCKYGTSFNSYTALPNTFSSTGGTSHSTTLTGLFSGTSYLYQVKCRDAAGNMAERTYSVLFSVASAPVTPPPVVPPVTPPVTPPAGGGSSGGTSGSSNEPSGMTLLNNRAFNLNCAVTNCEGGWYDEYRAGSLSIIADATAPKSAPNIGQFTYPIGFVGGSGPGSQEFDLVNPKPKTIYVSTWIKFSSNWKAHLTGTNKIIHFFVNGANKIYANAWGQGNGTLSPAFGLQSLAAAYNDGRGHTDTSPDLFANVNTSTKIIRGQWQHYEYLITANTPGVADGSAEMWLDGTKVLDYRSIMFIGSGGGASWSTIKFNPTWGGGGDSLTAAQTIQMDDFYMSGK